jgi:hypothetical protein
VIRLPWSFDWGEDPTRLTGYHPGVLQLRVFGPSPLIRDVAARLEAIPGSRHVILTVWSCVVGRLRAVPWRRFSWVWRARHSWVGS